MVGLLERPCLLVANASVVILLKNYPRVSNCVRNAEARFQLSSVHTVDPSFNKKGNFSPNINQDSLHPNHGWGGAQSVL